MYKINFKNTPCIDSIYLNLVSKKTSRIIFGHFKTFPKQMSPIKFRIRETNFRRSLGVFINEVSLNTTYKPTFLKASNSKLVSLSYSSESKLTINSAMGSSSVLDTPGPG